MFKFNSGYGCLICDQCRVIILEPAYPELASKEDFCEECVKTAECPECYFYPCRCNDKWFEDHKELMEDVRRKSE
jgi:hypothetical protein